LEDYVGEENPVRVIEVFIDELDLAALGFSGMTPAATGRPAYHPSTLLKIYLDGYLNIIVTFGITPLLSGAELAVAAGDRVCLVGRNGSGKSTLLRIAAGLVQPDAGDRFAQPGSTIYYLPQEPDLSGFASTLACRVEFRSLARSASVIDRSL
jgi:hypothetical protein